MWRGALLLRGGAPSITRLYGFFGYGRVR
jgi:hypothetical protein